MILLLASRSTIEAKVEEPVALQNEGSRRK